MSDEMVPRAFISYASQDEMEALRICKLIENRGVACWIAARDVAPGSKYADAILAALEQTTAFVLLLSDFSNASPHVHNEVERAFSKRKLIIPIRLSDVAPSKHLEYFISSAQRVDIWQGPMEKAMGQIVSVIRENCRASNRSPVDADRPSSAAPPAAPPKPWWKRAVWVSGLLGLLLGILLLVYHAWTAKHPAVDRSLMRGGESTGTTTGAMRAGGVQQLRVPRYHALVIGINQYRDLAVGGWKPLATARPDAESVARVLETEYGFDVQRLLDGHATRAAIIAALDNLVNLNDNDALVVFFAGHGFFDQTLNEGYWIPCDARKMEGDRFAKEDWLWNSILTKMVSASGARHVLIITDSCYGGALLQGAGIASATDPAQAVMQAIRLPSRALLASGGLEPVPDGHAEQSVFTKQLLEGLTRPDHDTIPFTELGAIIREHLKQQPGPSVQFGSLALAGNAGGEFVFVKRGKAEEMRNADLARPGERPNPNAPRVAETNRQEVLLAALALNQRGATNSARSLLHALTSGQETADGLLRAVGVFLDQERRAKSQQELRELIRITEQRKATAAPAGKTSAAQDVKPRIVACLGPTARLQSNRTDDDALLIRICLRNELEQKNGLHVVEREAVELVLQEMNLGSSALADNRAATTLGKLLPAGFLLMGDLLTDHERQLIFLRLVDTETTRVVGSFSVQRKPDEEIEPLCQKLAAQIMSKVISSKPFLVKVSSIQGNTVRAAIGSFQGLGKDMRFSLIKLDTPESLPTQQSAILGKAVALELGETNSTFTVKWQADASGMSPEKLWLQESCD